MRRNLRTVSGKGDARSAYKRWLKRKEAEEKRRLGTRAVVPYFVRWMWVTRANDNRMRRIFQGERYYLEGDHSLLQSRSAYRRLWLQHLIMIWIVAIVLQRRKPKKKEKKNKKKKYDKETAVDLLHMLRSGGVNIGARIFLLVEVAGVCCASACCSQLDSSLGANEDFWSEHYQLHTADETLARLPQLSVQKDSQPAGFTLQGTLPQAPPPPNILEFADAFGCCARLPIELRLPTNADTGAFVSIDGLEQAQELNGGLGKLVKFIPSTGRFDVQLYGVRLRLGKSAAIRTCNLRVLVGLRGFEVCALLQEYAEVCALVKGRVADCVSAETAEGARKLSLLEYVRYRIKERTAFLQLSTDERAAKQSAFLGRVAEHANIETPLTNREVSASSGSVWRRVSVWSEIKRKSTRGERNDDA